MYFVSRLVKITILICGIIVPVFSQSQKNIQDDYLRKVAVSTLEIHLAETRQIENFKNRLELAEEIIRLLHKKSPIDCLTAVEILFEDFLRLDAKVADDPESFIEMQENFGAKIINLASILDKDLAEKFQKRYIAKLSESLPEVGKKKDNPNLSRIYLKIASGMLDDNLGYAVSVAEISLRYEVNLETLGFLALVYAKDKSLADEFCLKAVRAVNERKLKDINESFVLYSYIFGFSQVPAVVSDSPIYFPVQHSVINQRNLNNNLAIYFIRSSVNILTNNQSRNYTDETQVSHGAVGDYFFLKTIEPQTGRNTPDILGHVVNRQVVLSNFLAQKKQESIQSFADKNNQNSNAERKLLTKEDYLAKAESEEKPQKKDFYFYKAAMLAIKDKSFDDALMIAGKLSENAEKTVKPFIKYTISQKLIENNEVERAVEISQKDLDATLKSSILIFGARKMSENKSDPSKTIDLLFDARKLIDKVEYGKSQLLTGVANVYADFDQTTALEVWHEAVKAANAQKDFTGNEKLQKSFDEGNGFYIFYELVDFDMKFPALMSKLSDKLFINTLQINQTIESKIFKIKSNKVLCKKILNKKPDNLTAK